MQTVSPFPAALALAALALGCVPTTSRQGVGGYCHRDDQCLAGLRCVDRECRAPRSEAAGDGDAGSAPALDAGASTDAGGIESDAGQPIDAGQPVDAGPPDAGELPMMVLDSGVVDAGESDSGPLDAGRPDARPGGGD